MIFNILDNTTELWMTKYIIGEIFSSGGTTLYKNPSDQTAVKRVIFWQIGPQQPVHLSPNYREGGINSVYFVSKIQVYYILNFLHK